MPKSTTQTSRSKPKSTFPATGTLSWLRLPDGTIRITASAGGRFFAPVESDSLATALADAVSALAGGAS